MGNTPLLSVALVLFGACLVGYSVYAVSRIVKELPEGRARTRWLLVRGFMFLIIAGLLLLALQSTYEPGTASLLVSTIFFLGGCLFVVVCTMARAMVRDIRRIDTLEIENITDPLMGIYNRRYLEQRLDEEFHRAKRYGFPLSLLLLDIDRFKEINDTYGHATGDRVLKELGAMLKNSIRKVDIAARYGGEEVVILLPHTKRADAAIVLERIRMKIKTHAFSVDTPAGEAATLRVNVSIGIAAMSPECATPAGLLHLADAAMYRAKQAGKTRAEESRGEPEALLPEP